MASRDDCSRCTDVLECRSCDSPHVEIEPAVLINQRVTSASPPCRSSDKGRIVDRRTASRRHPDGTIGKSNDVTGTPYCSIRARDGGWPDGRTHRRPSRASKVTVAAL